MCCSIHREAETLLSHMIWTIPAANPYSIYYSVFRRDLSRSNSAAKVNTTVEEELQYNAVQFSKSALWSVFCGVWSVCCGVSSVECGVSTVECLLWSVYCPLWSPYCGVSIVECGVHTVECLAVWARRALALSHCHHSIAWAAAEWCTATTSTALPPLLLLLHTTATTSIALCHHCYCYCRPLKPLQCIGATSQCIAAVKMFSKPFLKLLVWSSSVSAAILYSAAVQSVESAVSAPLEWQSLDAADTSQCWHITVLAHRSTGTSQCWHITVLTQHSADTTQCWHIAVLAQNSTSVHSSCAPGHLPHWHWQWRHPLYNVHPLYIHCTSTVHPLYIHCAHRGSIPAVNFSFGNTIQTPT